MSRLYFFLPCLLVLAPLLQGTNGVEYVVTNNASATPGGIRFENEIGVAYSIKTMNSATEFIWRIFQQNDVTERKNVQGVTLIIDTIPNNYVAYTINNEIHYSTNAIANENGDLKGGFAGVIYHEMAHIWQWNGDGHASGGLIEGIADFVRLKAGYVPSHWVQPGQGDKWDQGYDVTARFLDYCNGLRNGFVAELNKKMRSGYAENYFEELLGKTIDQLWKDYKAMYNN